MSKYTKPITGKIVAVDTNTGIATVNVDVYAVLDAFEQTDQALGHAIKKLLMPGKRGHKDRKADLIEAIQSIDRAIDMSEDKKMLEPKTQPQPTPSPLVTNSEMDALMGGAQDVVAIGELERINGHGPWHTLSDGCMRPPDHVKGKVGAYMRRDGAVHTGCNLGLHNWTFPSQDPRRIIAYCIAKNQPDSNTV